MADVQPGPTLKDLGAVLWMMAGATSWSSKVPEPYKLPITLLGAVASDLCSFFSIPPGEHVQSATSSIEADEIDPTAIFPYYTLGELVRVWVHFMWDRESLWQGMAVSLGTLGLRELIVWTLHDHARRLERRRGLRRELDVLLLQMAELRPPLHREQQMAELNLVEPNADVEQAEQAVNGEEMVQEAVA